MTLCRFFIHNGNGRNIHERELYVLRAMPSLYLLDSRQRVVLKDTPLPLLLHYLLNSMQ